MQMSSEEAFDGPVHNLLVVPPQKKKVMGIEGIEGIHKIELTKLHTEKVTR